MLKNNIPKLITGLLAFLIACKGDQVGKIVSMQPAVSFNLSRDSPVRSFDQLFEAPHFVKLVPKDTNTILASIDKIALYQGLYYVLDAKYSSLGSYSVDGKQVNSFGDLGLGSKQLKVMTDFFIDSVKGQIGIFSNSDKAIYYYDAHTANFLNKKEIGVFGSRVDISSDDKILVYVNYNDNDKSGKNNVLVLDSTGHVINRYFSYRSLKSPASLEFTGFLTKQYGQLYFANAYDDTIFTFRNGQVTAYADLGISSPFVKNNQSNKDLITQHVSDSFVSASMHTFLKNNDFIIGNVMDKGKVKVFVYSLANKRTSLTSPNIKTSIFSRFAVDPKLLTPDNKVLFSVSPINALKVLKKYPSAVDSIHADDAKILRNVTDTSGFFLMIAKIKPL